MTRKIVRLTDSFIAEDADGHKYVINVFTTFGEWNDTNGANEIAGPQKLKTSDGRSVNRIAKGQYEIVDILGDVRVSSIDPNAP